ncbi:tetratricopeptide repeat protein [Pseudomonas aeruginosa]|uniref:type VI secretion system accessory protein TagJ n=1 Tax=Pseudomonas aeruginosa TaxID=287 RepID=UPI000F822D07|nr:type VI secretion system accessory protein TagJ [Pseudomonas aeruginosa]MBG4477988.1 type VI secretion system accessory protein TagJ [Pseudomonas aeruginosa]RTT97049.1 tetratricopeptide repeat protein [Pseudomonas aeruginosa]
MADPSFASGRLGSRLQGSIAMIAEELLRAGRLDDALKALQEQVRSQPSNATLRIFLFQLLAVMGQWARAQNQLKVVGELDASALPMVQTYSTAIDCEALRREVFAGRLTPVILGQPAEWIAPLLQALSLDAEGHGEAAQALREQAFDAAPAVPGRIGEAPFAWLADADTRLGPVLEVIVNGRYAWLPMSNLRSLKVEAPSDLRDLVWLPAELTLANGGATVALLPARYAETVEHGDDAVRLGRKTEWLDSGLPVGQRLFVTDAGETALFDLRELDFEPTDA